MTRKEVNKVIKEVFPKIEKHYGFSKFQETTPYVETQYNIYEKYSGIKGMKGDEDGCHAEYCNIENQITVYYPNMRDRQHVIESLIHEYQHYLQSPTWFRRYYDQYGHDYITHPYEIAANKEEKNWKIFS